MSFEWLTWSNPVAIWWGFLVVVSIGNIGMWSALIRQARRLGSSPAVQVMLVLSAAYVFGCAFRSVLPRADVQRICLFDTWLSSVLLGRSVATIAELCFVMQCSMALRVLARTTNADTVRNIATAIVPLILLAEANSWYAVITTNYLGNAVENSLWLVAFSLVAAALLRLVLEYTGIVRIALLIALAGVMSYLAFLATVDVPMYLARWRTDLADEKPLLDPATGLHELATRWVVTRDIAAWRDEIPWMSLYFSAAVWASLALTGLTLVADRLSGYCRPARRPLPTAAPLGRVT